MADMIQLRNLYKCRMCGAIYTDSEAGGLGVPEEHAKHLLRVSSLSPPKCIHKCDEWRTGVGDFVGFETVDA